LGEWVFQQPVIEQGQITLEWTGPAGGVLMEAANLSGPATAWTAVPNAPSTTTNGTHRVTLPAQHPRRFYRIEPPH
jgi:hypothetical protein